MKTERKSFKINIHSSLAKILLSLYYVLGWTTCREIN